MSRPDYLGFTFLDSRVFRLQEVSMRNVKAMSYHRMLHINLLLFVFFLAAGCSQDSTPEIATQQTPVAPPPVEPVTVIEGMTAFEGARLIIGDGSAPVEDAVFIVEGDLITHVGGRGEVTVPDGVKRVNLNGKTVMPTIINTHMHLSGERETLINQLHQLAYFGVGAAASLGHDVSDVPFQVRDELIPGAARLLTAGRGISRPEPGRSDAAYWINSEEEGRTAVKEQADRKVDIIKIWVDDRNGQYEKLTPSMYAAIIDEAHRHDLRVTAHIFSLDDAKGLLRAGVDSFAHGIRDQDIDDEAVALFKDRPDVVLVPNLPDRGVAVDMSWLRGLIPDDELDKVQTAATDRPAVQQTFGIQARNLDRLNREGVRIAFGTDGSIVWASHMEMEDMVAAGMTPAEVIMAATRNSAELMKLNNTGTLAAGMSADFIVLDANPLDDITNTRRINAVYLRGVEVDRTVNR